MRESVKALMLQLLGPCRPLGEIGGGGMTTVYRAYDTRAGHLVALKVLLPHLCRDQEFVERFQREGRHAAVLDRDNIVPVYDSGLVDAYLYPAMAHIDEPGRAMGSMKNRQQYAVQQEVKNDWES
jgi:serine/threonine-protein kinase